MTVACKQVPYWSVALEGNKSDLRDWQHYLEPPFYPNLTTINVPNARGEPVETYSLRLSEFDTREESEFWKHVDNMIPFLLGLVMAVYNDNRGDIQVKYILWHDENGRITRHRRMVIATAHGSVRMRAYLRLNTEEPRQTVIQKAYNNFDEQRLRAAQYLADAQNWYDLYKAYEAMGQDSGLFKIGLDPDEVRRFRKSSTPHRHDKSSYKRIENPMSFDEAKKFMLNALKRRMDNSNY